MKKLLIFFLFFCPLLANSQSKSLDALRNAHKELPNSFNLSFGGNFIGLSNYILNEDIDQEVKELIHSIDNLHLFTLPIGEAGIGTNELTKLKKDMRNEAYEELIVIRDGKDQINMLIKEKNGIISSLVMLIEGEEDITILDFSGKIDRKDLSLLASKVDLSSE